MGCRNENPAAGGTARGADLEAVLGTEEGHITRPLIAVQAARLIERFGLGQDRARLIAEHAFATGGAR
jgi:hypothetical protein